MATLPTSSQPSPEHIFQTLNAHQQTAALKTAIELDVFTAIDEGNHRAEHIALSKTFVTVTLRLFCS